MPVRRFVVRQRTMLCFSVLGLVLVASVMGAGLGCGNRGDPIPPERLRPQPVRAVEARNVAEGIQLSWQPPTRLVNRQPIEGVKSFEVLRASGRTREQCARPGQAWLRVGSLDARGESLDTRFFFTDRDVVSGRWYAYRILATDLRGNTGEPDGSPVMYRGELPPEAPAPRIEPGDGFLMLTMPAFPDGVIGWRFYRSAVTDTMEPFGPLPSHDGLLEDTAYTDAGVVNERTYRYHAAWVHRDEGFLIEGPLSPVTEAVPQDLIPPPAPMSIVAVPAEGGVELRWERVAENTVRYHIYRRAEDEPRFRRVTDESIAVNRFTDDPPPGAYIYTVSALDAAGNESATGGQARVLVP